MTLLQLLRHSVVSKCSRIGLYVRSGIVDVRRFHSLTYAVATMFSSANFLATDVEQHQTLRTPSRATGCSSRKASANRFLRLAVRIAWSRTNRDAYRVTPRRGDRACNWEIYVPPANSSTKVKSAMTLF